VTTEVYAPLAICVVLAAVARWTSVRLPPRAGTWILALATAVGGICTVWTLGLLALSLVDDLPTLSPDESRDLPVPDWLSVLALVALIVVVARVLNHLRRRRRLRRPARALLDLPGDELVVLPDPLARAFAVPGPAFAGVRRGRIVATDSLLRVLTPAQRRVMLAHERAHLDGAHSVALSLARLAAAANPLLRPAAGATAFLSERHADERAAHEVGDRRLAASALAVAALAGADPSSTWDGIGHFHQIGVIERVRALRDPYRRGRPLGLVLAAAGAVIALAAVTGATHDFAVLIGPLLQH
jgi:beta-lactamase regulating signal transducer with metallopeptidase domain